MLADRQPGTTHYGDDEEGSGWIWPSSEGHIGDLGRYVNSSRALNIEDVRIGSGEVRASILGWMMIFNADLKQKKASCRIDCPLTGRLIFGPVQDFSSTISGLARYSGTRARSNLISLDNNAW